MPSISSVAAPLRATSEGLSLSLHVVHCVVLLSDPDPVLSTSTRLPESVDILSGSDIVLSLCGSFNHAQVHPDKLQKSALVHYLLSFLAMHSDELGLSHISRVYIDGDGTLKFTISSAHTLLHADQSSAPTATLTALTLTFSCFSCVSDGTDSFVHPFASQLLLPIQSTLNTVLKKFLSRDLVRRYPLIFGPWRHSLDLEIAMLPHICHSVLDIIHRSRNSSFRRRCLHMIKALRKRQKLAFSASLTELENFLGQSVTSQIETTGLRDFDDPAILSMSMQRLYRSLVRPQRLKVSATVLSLVDTEDHPFDLSPSATGFCSQRDLDEMIPDHIMDYHDITPYDTALISPHKMETSVAARSEPSPASLQESLLVLAHILSPSDVKTLYALDSEDLSTSSQPADQLCIWTSDGEDEDLESLRPTMDHDYLEQKFLPKPMDVEDSLDYDIKLTEWTSSPIPNMDVLDCEVQHPETFIGLSTCVFSTSSEQSWCADEDVLLDFGEG